GVGRATRCAAAGRRGRAGGRAAGGRAWAGAGGEGAGAEGAGPEGAAGRRGLGVRADDRGDGPRAGHPGSGDRRRDPRVTARRRSPTLAAERECRDTVLLSDSCPSPSRNRTRVVVVLKPREWPPSSKEQRTKTMNGMP